uniref:Uncharacterized protein n=1 Tax=Oryza brachyantha TaxID=4533 RepID=J3N7G5_ORYBR
MAMSSFGGGGMLGSRVQEVRAWGNEMSMMTAGVEITRARGGRRRQWREVAKSSGERKLIMQASKKSRYHRVQRRAEAYNASKQKESLSQCAKTRDPLRLYRYNREGSNRLETGKLGAMWSQPIESRSDKDGSLIGPKAWR